jgi:uncharacterized OB-fold protein
MAEMNRAMTGLPGQFWDAAGRGKLMLMCCGACGEVHFYPRPICPFCASRQVDWVEASGRGVVYSFAVLRRKGVVVSVPARVTLEEGPTMLTSLVGGSPDTYRIGLPVEVTFVATADQPSTPVFGAIGKDRASNEEGAGYE